MKINNWSVVKSPIGISLMHIEDKRPTGLEVCISVVDGKVNINAYQDTSERTWVGLTDEEMQDLWDRYAHMEMMRAIEAKLKEKNT